MSFRVSIAIDPAERRGKGTNSQKKEMLHLIEVEVVIQVSIWHVEEHVRLSCWAAHYRYGRLRKSAD
jgi:hypothetical protein